MLPAGDDQQSPVTVLIYFQLELLEYLLSPLVSDNYIWIPRSIHDKYFFFFLSSPSVNLLFFIVIFVFSSLPHWYDLHEECWWFIHSQDTAKRGFHNIYVHLTCVRYNFTYIPTCKLECLHENMFWLLKVLRLFT